MMEKDIERFKNSITPKPTSFFKKGSFRRNIGYTFLILNIVYCIFDLNFKWLIGFIMWFFTYLLADLLHHQPNLSLHTYIHSGYRITNYTLFTIFIPCSLIIHNFFGLTLMVICLIIWIVWDKKEIERLKITNQQKSF